MATSSIPGYQLPVQPETGGRQTQGFVTPTQDRLPQKVAVVPKRVLPIVFLPGTMGSNLRLSARRQQELRKENNIAWRPDRKSEASAMLISSPARRQQLLDPAETEVDVYAPDAPTGNPKETPEQRHDNVEVNFLIPIDAGIATPLLMDDPPTANPRRTKQQKARERGWGEIFFDSYGELLQRCELRLNTAFRGGILHPWWRSILNVAPAVWQAHPDFKLQPLTQDELRQALTGCWFPVHAMGYNWLKSNRQSGIDVSQRIKRLIAQYQSWGFQCEKVIVVTHSMGGLVARALIHPKMGNLQDMVLGVVHGVMPAMGAATAYKRMRCGFEDGGVDIAAKVIGNFGDEITAVLGNSPGGLELLPSRAYGNEWLCVSHKGETSLKLPKNGDPYAEIYKLREPWYRLINEVWLNPANLKNCSMENTLDYLLQARDFHADIDKTYHPNSYAHYGAGKEHAAWHRLVWSVGNEVNINVEMKSWQIVADNRQGTLRIIDPLKPKFPGVPAAWTSVRLLPAAEPGDQTVPTHSADHQFNSRMFKGIFRQTGYEHQSSYKNENALHCTLYSLVRIIGAMGWAA